jgi:flagellar motor switch/type III secretory pathway protein FliN
VTPRPFDLAACPRVRPRDARATRAALRTCARLPARWPIVLPPLGSAVVEFAGVDVDDAERIAGVDLAISFGVGRGRVRIEFPFASRLVDAVLGGTAVFSEARAAGPAERGVLAGVLAPLFDRVGGSVHLGPLPARDGATAAILFRLETAVASGWLRLTPPVGGLSGVPVPADDASMWRARASRIPVTASVELARTAVPARELARVAIGDAIVFDGARAARFAADAPWDGHVRVGDHAADVTVDVAGGVSIVGGFSPVQPQEGNMSASGSNIDATTVLGAASIEVVAELGRIALRGDEVLGLAPGVVLAVGKGRPGVTLRVGGEIWADGEIVDIDGELGVRVTRLANR